MLHDQHSVAHVAQFGQSVEKPVVVARMKTDGRFIEHVENAAQFGTDLRGEADALRFPARERRRAAIEAQVVQADGFEKFQTAADFIDDASGDLQLAICELPGTRRQQRARNRHRREFRDGNDCSRERRGSTDGAAFPCMRGRARATCSR